MSTTPRPRPPPCPHCADHHVQRWGRTPGSQRYRCQGCLKTFIRTTGTAVHYLKRRDRWPAFCQAMSSSLTLQQAADVCGIHRSTAFRWRHRFLACIEMRDDGAFPGHAAIGVRRFAYTRKGSRTPADPHVIEVFAGAKFPSDAMVPVVFARDTRGFGIGFAGVIGARHDAVLMRWALTGRVTPGTVLRGSRGPYSPPTVTAAQLGIRYMPLGRHPGPDDPEDIPHFVIRLRAWLRRFRGVSTKYLSRYILWYLLLEADAPDEHWDLAAAGAWPGWPSSPPPLS